MLDNVNDDNAMEARYHRAQALFQGMWTKKVALNGTLFPHWIEESDCFWYERELEEGKQYRLVNAPSATNELAFDHNVLGNALAKAAGQAVDANDLPINKVDITLVPLKVQFSAFGKRWVFEENSQACEEVEVLPEDEVLSPDGKRVAFARDFNLWIRTVASGEERALTGDGEASYVYAATGDAWGEPPVDSGLQVRWSPDSQRILTVQRDTRQVKTLPMVNHVQQDGSLRPTVSHVKLAFPGDDHVPAYRLVAIDVETGKTQEANYRRFPVVRNGWGYFNAGLGWWATDSRRAYFIDQERGDQVVRVVEFDTHTGATRVLFEERSDTHINLSANSEDYPCFVPLPESQELIWWSERSGWAHLYLYDLETGALKNPITQGEWLVREVLQFDAEHRELFIQTAGRVPGRDPYYRDLCRVNVDTGVFIPLTDSDDDYLIVTPGAQATMLANAIGRDVSTAAGVAPGGDFSVVTRSRADTVPVSLLLDRTGKEILTIETADISGLPEGWQWPEPVKLQAADGKTDTYGLVFRPSDFSPEKSYPVLSHVFSTPELPWVAKGSFSNSMFLGQTYFDAAAVAELGFIVVQIDGRGTPYRSKAFYDEMYGWAPSVSNPDDHVAGIRQLAERYPYMDLDRVGIYSPQAALGGVMGLLVHPDFYKVGVNMCAVDSRVIASTLWGDKYEGVSGPSSEHQYPEQLIEKLRGKLLLLHGMLDAWCPPAATFRLVEALQQANKDFDLILLPSTGHMLSGYAVRRSWDYLVRHLQSVEPPKDFRVITGFDVLFSDYV